MAVAERGGLFTTKPAHTLVSEADEQGHQLRRSWGSSTSRLRVRLDAPRRDRRAALLISVLAAFVPLTTIAELVNIGTLFAFVLVNVGVTCRATPGCDSWSGWRSGW